MKRTTTELLDFANAFYQEHDRLPTSEELQISLQMRPNDAKTLAQSLRVVEMPLEETDWTTFDPDEPLPIWVIEPLEAEQAEQLSV